MSCVFCAIVAGDIPARMIYEDDVAVEVAERARDALSQGKLEKAARLFEQRGLCQISMRFIFCQGC